MWLSARLRMAALAMLAMIVVRAVASGLAPEFEPPAPASAAIHNHNAKATEMQTGGDLRA
jgi:hypothetical protein